MYPLFAGLLEGALIGGAVGLAVGVVMVLLPGKPCPQCKQPLRRQLFGALKACPKCGCKLNARGEKVEGENEGR